jgi:protease I
MTKSTSSTTSSTSSPTDAPKRIACLLADGFEDSELEVPQGRLRAAGYAVEVIGAEVGQELQGYKGRVTARVDLSIVEAEVKDYEGLLIPGGHSPDQLRADVRFVEFVVAFNETGRPLGAVCHGPQLLLTAGLVKGRTLTAWSTVQGDLRQAGAAVRDEEVVVDDNWITSRKPEDLEAFSAKFLEELKELETRGSQTRKPQAKIVNHQPESARPR